MESVASEKCDETKLIYLGICRELNMDKETEKNSWEAYEKISKNFTLEGDPRHWFCCSLYTGCRESVTPIVGNTTSLVKGNCVSLTKLLRCCQISIHDFFHKIKIWIDVTSSQNFLNHVERLEKSFGVSYLLFQKYVDIFEKIFVISLNEKKNKKSKPGKCTAIKLYDFCWCLFLCAKGEDPKHTVDIVSSFHLLLCCIDLVFLNAMEEKREDIINSSFMEKSLNNVSSTCTLNILCEMYDAQFVEAKEMKLYSFKNSIKKFFLTKTLQGESETYMSIISNSNFEPNLKSLNNSYEQYVLSVGDFDERIFLSNINLKKFEDADRMKHSQYYGNIKSLTPGTPMTRRYLLPSKDFSEPITNSTENVEKLQKIADITNEPEFLKNAEATISQKLQELIKGMCKTFCQKYSIKSEAEKRFSLAKKIYYHLLDKIVRAEIKNRPNLDLKILLQYEVLHISLIACCLEVVIFAYNSSWNGVSMDLKFPWILDCFDLQPFNFYKIIELVVSNNENALTRSLIIHLNKIEEKCLDSLVWRSNSVLWEKIKQLDGIFPLWITVDRKNSNLGLTTVKKMDGSNLERNLLLSPINSAYESFKQSSNDSARRDLFNAGKATVQTTPNKQESSDRRGAGSIFLFCRKFYKLAFMRISELCKKLEMSDDENLDQIWTLFEHSVVKNANLIQDRHLDQIIMCAIYVFIKVKDIRDKTFTDIMKFYRSQPQADSHIYREVLIKPAKINDTNGETCAATYNDIIYFYNNVYVQKMTPYALEFGDKTKSKKNLLLSPHPPEKIPSPKQLLLNHHLYIQPLEKTHIIQSPKSFTYEFCKSPAKDLEKINQLVRGGKRNLPFNDDENVATENNELCKKKPFIPRKMQTIIREKHCDDKK